MPMNFAYYLQDQLRKADAIFSSRWCMGVDMDIISEWRHSLIKLLCATQIKNFNRE